MNRSANSEMNFTSRYSRRLAVLFFIGLLHAIFFYVGDILTVYALTGFILLLFRNASDKLLLRSAIILLLLPVIQYSFFWTSSLVNSQEAIQQDNGQREFFDHLVLTYQIGTFGDIVVNNIGGLIFGRYPDLFFTGRFFRVLAMFLIGFYAMRTINFNNLSQHRPFLSRLLIGSACVGFPCNIILALMMETNAYYDVSPLGIIQPLVYAFGVPALCLFYASGFALLYIRAEWRKILGIFAPVGQLALTNYLMQSVICCFIFMSYGLGWFGNVGPAILTAIALIIFTGQVVFSHWWIKHFRFGPMEWLWRSLTYRKWQPIRKEVTYLGVHERS